MSETALPATTAPAKVYATRQAAAIEGRSRMSAPAALRGRIIDHESAQSELSGPCRLSFLSGRQQHSNRVIFNVMTLFSFHVTGHGAPDGDVVADCESQDAAHQEAVAICSDLARDAFKKIAPNAQWQMTVADDTGKTVFRFRIREDDV